MNLVCQGLSRTGGDLKSSSSGSPSLRVAAAASSSVSSSESPGFPNFALGCGMGRHYCTSSIKSPTSGPQSVGITE